MKCKIIKKISFLILIISLMLLVYACKKKNDNQSLNSDQKLFNYEENIAGRKIAVAYFSINDDVEELAEKFAEALNADIFEIIPEVPYSEEDLNFYSDSSRVKLEDKFNPFDRSIDNEDEEYETSEGIKIATKSKIEDKKRITELPKIKSNNAKKYPIIVLGFPIWYENAPKVIYTFMQGLKNKVVVPFCTTGEMGQVDQYLSNITDDSVQVMSGKAFDKFASTEEIKEWVTMLSADFDISY